MKETKATTGRSPQAAPVTHAAGTKLRFQVRYYRRMRQHHVYPAVVSARSLSGGAGAGATVTLRAVIPGALVTPGELSLDVSDPKAAATFYVTPVARGWLPESRIEVHRQGAILQSIYLPMRATTQCLTWVLAFLTLAIPAFLLYTTVYHRLQGHVPRTPTQAILGGRGEAKEEQPKEGGKGEPRQPPVNPVPGQQPITQGASQQELLRAMIGLIPANGAGDVQKDQKKKDESTPPKPEDEKKEAEAKEKSEPKAEVEPIPVPLKKEPTEDKKAGPPPGKQKQRPGKGPKIVDVPIPEDPQVINPADAARMPNVVQRPGMPGELLKAEIINHVPEAPYQLYDQFPALPKITVSIAEGIGQLYEIACALAIDKLSYYVGLVFLFLTIGSLVTHRAVRGRRSGEPVVLTF